MSCDLRVLVVNAKIDNCKLIKSTGKIVIERDNGFGKLFSENYRFVSKQSGTWFSLSTEKYDYLGAFEICDADFEAANIKYPFWTEKISNEAIFFPLIINENFYSDFKNSLQCLIDLSPEKTIVFLPRFQGEEKDNICGVISFERFFQLLDDKQILFNICYIIG